MDRVWVRDAAERIIWTAVQAGLGVALVLIADLDLAWTPVVATVLAAVKAAVARRVGDSHSASTLPHA